MSKVRELIKILSPAESPKLPVQVGDKCEQLTQTQAFRLEQITAVRSLSEDTIQTRAAMSADDFCSLIEASFQSGISESELASVAASEQITFYVDGSGLELREERASAEKPSSEREYQPLQSGFLALAVDSCRDIAEQGLACATSLTLPFAQGATRTNLALRSPLQINRHMVLLLKSQLRKLTRPELRP